MLRTTDYGLRTPRFSFCILHFAFALGLSLVAVTPVQSATSNAPPVSKKTNTLASASGNGALKAVSIPKSHFGSEHEMGKDPFYPDSARFQAKIPVNQTNKVVAVAPEVRINGFSGNAARPLVILNNVTFGEGDEQMVMTVAGRARVRCVAIRTQEQAAEVEINGQRRELKFQGRK